MASSTFLMSNQHHQEVPVSPCLCPGQEQDEHQESLCHPHSWGSWCLNFGKAPQWPQGHRILWCEGVTQHHVLWVDSPVAGWGCAHGLAFPSVGVGGVSLRLGQVWALL